VCPEFVSFLLAPRGLFFWCSVKNQLLTSSALTVSILMGRALNFTTAVMGSTYWRLRRKRRHTFFLCPRAARTVSCVTTYMTQVVWASRALTLSHTCKSLTLANDCNKSKPIRIVIRMGKTPRGRNDRFPFQNISFTNSRL